MDELLFDTLVRWTGQRRTDNQETPLDDYGKRVIYEVIRILPTSERKKPITVDHNRQHLVRLKKQMWNVVGHFSNELDEYASKLFERPIRGSWRIFVHMAKHGVPHEEPGNHWYWEDISGDPHYPAAEQMSFELFASIFLHEVAHGWYYLLTDHEAVCKWLEDQNCESPRENQTNWRRCEEEICWEISRFVCKLLGIVFDEDAIPKAASS